jgi:hypothetical protein
LTLGKVTLSFFIGYNEVVAEAGRATDDVGARRLAGIVDMVARSLIIFAE